MSDYVNTNQGAVNVTVQQCLFMGNGATGNAALNLKNGGALNVSQTTAGTGSASFALLNSTLYGNGAENTGGALALASANTGTGTNQMTLTSLTVTQNHAGSGGGGIWINQTDSSLLPQLGNSIIAANSLTGGGAASSGPDIFGSVLSRRFNLVGVIDGSTGWVAGDQWGNAGSPLDPGLAPAGPTNNGGCTDTIQLVQGSPAYNQGDASLAGQPDQRGFIRQYDPADNLLVSIGAYDPNAQ